MAKKLTIEFIKEQFENVGYKLLNKEYVGALQKLDYICPKGHKHLTTWRRWNSGHRCPTCVIINNSGSNHPNWKGGISCEPYCAAWADKEYKESIKERDGYMCLNPYCLKKSGRASDLTIHHIDYNKKNCGPNNLITICRSCNCRANFNRQWHQQWYQTIMTKRYNYILQGVKNYGTLDTR